MTRKPLTQIQKSARGEDCALRIPGVCNFDTATTVLCHAPYPGRGGTRLHDWWAAYGCYECHAAVDNRDGFYLSEEYSRFCWMPAIHETQTKLKAKGLM